MAETMFEKFQLCPLCAGSNLVDFTAPKIWVDKEHFAAVKDYLGLTRCLGCGVVLTNPRPNEELLTSFYNKLGYECHSFDFGAGQAASDTNARLSILERFQRPGLLLDFGPGAGHLLRAAQGRGWQVAGIELGQHARQALQREGFDVYADLAAARGLRGQVAAVTMTHVLEHLIHPATILSGIRELLRPDGVFFVEVPNGDSLRARLAESFFRRWFTAETQRYQAYPIHLYYFNPRSFVFFLAQAGFEVIKLGTLGLGVEELWVRAQADSSRHLDSDKSPGKQVASYLRINSAPARYQGVKKFIKASMSYLKLGEHLVAVCRRSAEWDAKRR